MRGPQEEEAGSTHNSAKTTLIDGVSFRYVWSVGRDDDAKRYTQLLKHSLQLPPPSQCISPMQRLAGSATSWTSAWSTSAVASLFLMGTPHLMREWSSVNITALRQLYGMLPPHVRVHDVKPCLGAGTIRRGVTALFCFIRRSIPRSLESRCSD